MMTPLAAQLAKRDSRTGVGLVSDRGEKESCPSPASSCKSSR